LSALANVYRTYARRHPGRYTATRFLPGTATPELVEAGRRHSELLRAVLRGYELGEPAQTDAVRLLGSTIHGYIELESAGSFAFSQPSSDDSWPRILDALDTLLRSWS
jgi:hypothetical protein